MKIVLAVMGFIMIWASGIAYAQSTVKIGIVDLQRVIRESQAGKTAKGAFEKEFQDKRRIIEQKTEQLSRDKQDYISKAPVMEDSARKQRAEDIDRREKDLNRTRDDFRDELQKRDFELTQKILTELESVIQSIGDSGGYTLIIEKTEGGVIYSVKAVDVTDQVIQSYDSKKAGSTKK
ncbi:MAG TPA: OmpH family outer membrane protein [Thermodesulfobacteriota bacterium]|jgi:outer membrane protein